MMRKTRNAEIHCVIMLRASMTQQRQQQKRAAAIGWIMTAMEELIAPTLHATALQDAAQQSKGTAKY